MPYAIEPHHWDPSLPYVNTGYHANMPTLQPDHSGMEQNNKAGGPQEGVNAQTR